MPAGYRLGLPLWSVKEWVGSVYPPKTKTGDFLGRYTDVFDTVEGNTTFYSEPSPETVAKWRESTPDSFRFAFKLPRFVTHELKLGEGADVEAEHFLFRMEPLGPRLGPFMVQLPPSFGPRRLRVLDTFLAALPDQHSMAVELRHPAFFASDRTLSEADDVLGRHGAERVIMDTRGLRAGDADHPSIAAARHKKPDLPVRPVALHRFPLVRLIFHPEPAVNAPYVAEWAERVAAWIREGREPYVMVHTPDNTLAPPLARTFHEAVAARIEVGELTPWPGEVPPEPQVGEQLSLL